MVTWFSQRRKYQSTIIRLHFTNSFTCVGWVVMKCSFQRLYYSAVSRWHWAAPIKCKCYHRATATHASCAPTFGQSPAQNQFLSGLVEAATLFWSKKRCKISHFLFLRGFWLGTSWQQPVWAKCFSNICCLHTHAYLVHMHEWKSIKHRYFSIDLANSQQMTDNGV